MTCSLELLSDRSEHSTVSVFAVFVFPVNEIMCPVCSEKALDPLGHHAITCTHGGDVVTRHILLQDVVANLFHQAHLGVTVEVGL